MTAKEFQDQLIDLLNGEIEDDFEFLAQIERVTSFRQAGIMTNNLGVQVELYDGESIQMEFLGTW